MGLFSSAGKEVKAVMAAKTPSRLLEYLMILGPSTKLPEEISGSPSSSGSWEPIYQPSTAILRRYPAEDHDDLPLQETAVYFCQPEGCCTHLIEPASHVFMLTNTETNLHTYGTCLSFPYLIDPVVRAQSQSWQYENKDSVAIQEWGVLTLCILSQWEYFRFFEKCLRTLVRYVDEYGGSQLTWDLLVHAQFQDNNTPVQEVEEWILNLLNLPAPVPGKEVLEVELEVDPAILLGYPPASHLPLVDFSISELFKELGVPYIIELYKLLLSEQKVCTYRSQNTVKAKFLLNTMV